MLEKVSSTVPKTIEFHKLGLSEITFIKTRQMLLGLGVREDITDRLACYAAFHDQEFRPGHDVLVAVREEAGLEPAVKGQMAS